MVKENIPVDQNEDDDDEEKDESSSSTTSKLPGFVTSSTVKPEKIEPQKPRLTFTEKLFAGMTGSKIEDANEGSLDEEIASDTTEEIYSDETATGSPVVRMVSEQATFEDDNSVVDLDIEEPSKADYRDYTAEEPSSADESASIERIEPDESHDEPTTITEGTTESNESVATEEDPESSLIDSGDVESPPSPSKESLPAEFEEPVEPEHVEPVTTPAGSPLMERRRVELATTDREAQHQQELDDTAYRSERLGQRKGLSAGLLAGWFIGRRGKKKAEKVHTKELETKNIEIKKLKNEQFAAKMRLDSIKRNQEQIAANIHQTEPAHAEQKKPIVETTEKVATFTDVKTERATKQGESIVSQVVEKVITGAPEVIAFATAEAISNQNLDDEIRPKSTERKKREPIEELPPEDKPIQEETYQVAEGTRVETSAWHRIEVDAVTGKPVKNPEVSYGQEFKREQKQEIMKDDKKGGFASVGAIGALVTSSTTNAPVASGPAAQGGSGVDPSNGSAQNTMQDRSLSEQKQVSNNTTAYVVAVVLAVVLIGIFIIVFLS